MTLRQQLEGFEPENPILDVTIPQSPEEGIAIGGDEMVITQAGVDTQSNAHLFGDKDVIYPEVQTDTDLLVSPLSSGVEIFDQLRSIESPEVLRFDFDLPEGAQMQANGGAVEVHEGAELSAMVLPPHAVDAQGTFVPVGMELEGSSIVLTVEHREGDYAYPILVDPEYYVQNDWVNAPWYGGNNYHVLEDGTFQTWWNNAKLQTSRWCINNCWGSGRGLFVTAPSGYYPGNQQAHWTYTPPGETSYLSGYLINPFFRWDTTNPACWSGPQPNPHDFDGLWSPAYQIYYQLYKNRALATNAAVYGNTAQTAKVMVFGLNTGNSANNPCWRDIYAGGIATYMTDPDSPTLDPVSGFPTGWFDNSKMHIVNVSAHDKGLGVKNIWLLAEGKPDTPLFKNDCQGTHGSPCYRDMWGPLEFNGNNFDEGRTLAKVTAQDALARAVNSASWWAYVDNLPPEVTLSGQLAAATNEGGNEEHPPGQGDELSLPVYNLEIKAEDGFHDPADPEKWRSGVKAIKVFLDESQTPLQEWTQSCPTDSCSMTQTFTLKLSGLSVGEHTLRVIATDQLGHPREREIEFEYIPATGMKDEYVMHYFPLPDGQGNEEEEERPDRPELAVNVVNGNLVYREKDVEVVGYAADLEVERYYNSLLPEKDNSEWGDGWTLAQTPDLDPQEPEGSGPPEVADAIGRSGTFQNAVKLPTEAGESRFDPVLQATIRTLPGGGYSLTDESGETEETTVFDEEGTATEVQLPGYVRLDYGYEDDALEEIQVKDPASVTDLSQLEEEELEYVSPQPVYQSAFGTLGTGNGQLKSPGDVAVAANGDLWVVDRANNRIQRLNSAGEYISKFGSTGSGNGQFNRPTSIAIDTAGNLWVTDADNHRIQKFSASGEFLKAVGSLGDRDRQIQQTRRHRRRPQRLYLGR